MAQIVVVEDDPDLRLLLELQLSVKGHAVAAAADGQRGIDLCRAQRPDLVTLDWNMPGMSGLEVCRAIRADAELAHTSILMVSAYTTAEQRSLAMKAGADGFLAKPYDLSGLHHEVGAMLQVAARSTVERREGVSA